MTRVHAVAMVLSALIWLASSPGALAQGQADNLARLAAQQHAQAVQQLKAAKAEAEKLKREAESLAQRQQDAQSQADKAKQELARDTDPAQAIEQLRKDISQLNTIYFKLVDKQELTLLENKELQRMMGNTFPTGVLLLEMLKELIERKKRELMELQRRQADAQRAQRLKQLQDAATSQAEAASKLAMDLEAKQRELRAADEEVKRKIEAEEAARRRMEETAEAARRERVQADLDRAKKLVEDRRKELESALEKLRRTEEEAQRRTLDARRFAQLLEGMRKLLDELPGLKDLPQIQQALRLIKAQLQLAQAILEAAIKLVPNPQQLTRNPDGTYSYNRAGGSLIHDLIEAINELVRAQRRMEAALEALRKAQVASNYSLSSDLLHRDQAAPSKVLGGANQAFSTGPGRQAFAMVDRLASTGDLRGLEALAEQLRQTSAHWDAAATADAADFASSHGLSTALELDRAADVAEAVVAEVASLRQALAEMRRLASETVEVPEGSAALSAWLQTLTVGRETPLLPGLNVDNGAFRADVFDRFSANLARELTMSRLTQPGAAVVKGNAAYATPGAPPVVGATVTLSLELAPDPSALDAPPQAKALQTVTNERGEYELVLPPGTFAAPPRLVVAGEGVGSRNIEGPQLGLK